MKKSNHFYKFLFLGLAIFVLIPLFYVYAYVNSGPGFVTITVPSGLSSQAHVQVTVQGTDINSKPVPSQVIDLFINPPTSVPGACGTANGGLFSSLTSTSPGLCANSTTVASFLGSGPWTWGCNGLNGGTNTASNACSAGVSAIPTASLTVNGSSSITESPGQAVTYVWGYSGSVTSAAMYLTVTKNGSQATDPYNNSSGPVSGYYPAGNLTANIAPLQVGYVYTFSYTATGPGGTSAPAVAVITVSASCSPVNASWQGCGSSAVCGGSSCGGSTTCYGSAPSCSESDPCNAYSDSCGDCTNQNACGWSISGNICETGNISGSNSGDSSGSDWAWINNQCPVQTQPNNSSCGSIIAPNSVTTGQNFSATIVMQNTGSNTWYSDPSVNPYHLGSQNVQDNTRWSTNREYMPSNTAVSTGSHATFAFTATAPTSAALASDSSCTSLGGGSYSCPFNWEMVQEGVQWFGSACTDTVVVNPVSAALVSCTTNVCTNTTAAGYFYDPNVNQMISSYCVSQYDNCSVPTYVINGTNYWFREGGKDTSTCLNLQSPAPTCNLAPSAPVISGPTTGVTNTNYTFTASATDPSGEQVRYGFDWNDDGVVDAWVPAGVSYVNSGTAQSASDSWPTIVGGKFQVLTQNTSGVNSAWTPYTITLSNQPTVTLSANPTSVASGGSTTLTWSSSGVSSCSASGGWNGSEATSGSQVVTSLTNSTSFTLTCQDSSGDIIAQTSFVTIIQPSFSLTVNPSVGGSVTSADGNISCGSTCTYPYSSGSVVTLTAIPESSDWKFVGWTGDCTGSSTCSITVNGSKTVNALFVPNPSIYQEF